MMISRRHGTSNNLRTTTLSVASSLYTGMTTERHAEYSDSGFISCSSKTYTTLSQTKGASKSAPHHFHFSPSLIFLYSPDSMKARVTRPRSPLFSSSARQELKPSQSLSGGSYGLRLR